MQSIIQNLKSSIKKKLFQRYFFGLFYYFNIFLPRSLFSRSRSHPPLVFLVYPVLDPIKPWESLGWQADMYYVCMSYSHRMTALECLNDKS